MVEDFKVSNAELPPKALSEQAEATTKIEAFILNLRDEDKKMKEEKIEAIESEIDDKDTQSTEIEKKLNPKARSFVPRSIWLKATYS